MEGAVGKEISINREDDVGGLEIKLRNERFIGNGERSIEVHARCRVDLRQTLQHLGFEG